MSDQPATLPPKPLPVYQCRKLDCGDPVELPHFIPIPAPNPPSAAEEFARRYAVMCGWPTRMCIQVDVQTPDDTPNQLFEVVYALQPAAKALLHPY